MGLQRLGSVTPTVMWVPAALVGAGMLLPLVYLVLRAAGGGVEAWDLVARPRTLEILIRSVFLAVVVTGACVAIGVPLAWLTVRTDLPFRRVWSLLTMLPLVIPSYVAGFLVVVALGHKGMLQGWLAPLGVERLPDIYGFAGAALTLVLVSYPYVLLTARAALSRLDPALEESSRSLGQGSWNTFRRVILPTLRPAIAAGSLLVALYTLSDFGAVSLLRYETFTWAIYIQYESAFNRTLAAVLSLVLVALALGILAVEARTRGRLRYYSSSGGSQRPPPPVQLGTWRWPALAFCAVVVVLSLVMPMAVLSYWVIRGVDAGEPFLFLWHATFNSVYVSGLAAIATVGCSLPVAFLAFRYPSRASAVLERVSYTGFVLPGIVVALALVFFATSFAWPLYQTIGLLIFGYVVLFIPTAVGAVRGSLLQLSPQLEEAARGLGKSAFWVCVTVSFPIVRPGILAGAALVFLLTMKELPATLILSPIGFKTLATYTWAAASEAFFAQAAAPALLLVLVSSVPLAFLTLKERRLNL